MDSIINDVEDFAGFLELPNEFRDEISIDDLDSLDFINDIDENFMYDCDIDLLNQQSETNNYIINHDNQRNANVNTNSNSNNYYRNSIFNDLPLVFANNMPPKEPCATGHTMIRELLACDNGVRANMSQVTRNSNDRNNNADKHNNNNNNNININNSNNLVLNIRPSDHRNITPKHPTILPATSVTSNHLHRTPTLAATLIGIQSNTNNDNMDADSCSFGSGKVVRRNSHNAIEKRYRLSINDRIDELRQMLSLGDNSKMNKSAVLRKAVERIQSLEQENNSLKCDNYKLRKSIVSGSSNESINHTGSSPLSNHSDSGHSITNSPSSSSMHSTSVSSSFLFFKNNENQSCVVGNSNKGIKRPLIYDNTSAPIKTEKLARLLLSSGESYKHSGHLKEIHNDHNKRLHSSNVPSFLLCTMALFVVAFQPLDIILNNYRTKTVTSTGGRRILQKPDSSDSHIDSVGVTIIFSILHWLLAFLLVWGSTKNRYLLTKLMSYFLGRIKSMTVLALHYNTAVNGDNIDNVERRVAMWRKDPTSFDSKLRDQLRVYHCECPTSLIMYSVQLCTILCSIVTSYAPFNLTRTQPDKDAHRISMFLLTCAVERSIIGNWYGRLQSMWYKVVLVLALRRGQCDERTMLSKVILAQSLSPDLIRRYLVNKQLTTMLPLLQSLPDKYRCVFTSIDMRKIFVKNSIQKVKEILRDDYLMMCNPSDMVCYYYMAYVHNMMASVAKKLLAKEVICPNTKETLTLITSTSSIMMDDVQSRYINTLFNFIVSLTDFSRQQHIQDMANKLLYHYNYLLSINSVEEPTRPDIQQMIYTLRLFLSTLRLVNGTDNEVHEVNLNFISHITETPITNMITQLIFDASLDAIINSLNGHNCSLSRHRADIYYVDRYNSQLRDYADRHATVSDTMASKFKMLFETLCQLNPIKSGLPNIDCNDKRQFEQHCYYRVTELISLDCGATGHRECNNLKIRSH